MKETIENQIISELKNLPDSKGYTLLEYLNFLKREPEQLVPNAETIAAINEVEAERNTLRSYQSAEELFRELDIKTLFMYTIIVSNQFKKDMKRIQRSRALRQL